MGYVLTRPEPTTLPPYSRNGSRGNIANNCAHCGSGIDVEDKCCTHCGAPNENYSQVIEKKQETWGECIRQLENTEPAKWQDNSKQIEVRGGIGSPLLYVYTHTQ